MRKEVAPPTSRRRWGRFTLVGVLAVGAVGGLGALESGLCESPRVVSIRRGGLCRHGDARRISGYT